MDIPIGTIILWSGSAIPSGWQICDGTNGTPNIIDKFVYATISDATLKNTGGQVEHIHTPTAAVTGTNPNHAHGGLSGNSGQPSTGVMSAVGNPYYDAQDHIHAITINVTDGGSHNHATSDTGLATSIPVHIKLAFIMRLS